MNKKFESSELVLAPNGTPYHIRMKPEMLADKVILVGDPARVDLVASRFDRVNDRTSNRELVSCSGEVGKKNVTVLSTGMGVGCIDIVVNELDICANIDLKTHQAKPLHRTLDLVRIGTCGSLQPEAPIGSAVCSRYVIGTDGLAYYYDMRKVFEKELTMEFCGKMNWQKPLPTPYAVEADKELLERLTEGCIQGITVTAPGFYAPQGRKLRYGLFDSSLNSRLRDFTYKGFKIMNLEMETSALYALGKMLGHRTLTLCSVIAGRSNGTFSGSYRQSIEGLIDLVLEKI